MLSQSGCGSIVLFLRHEMSAFREIHSTGRLSRRARQLRQALMVHSEAVERCQKVLKYIFKDRPLLEAALTHASSADTRLESNERLEFLGDAVLGLIICDELYHRFPELMEGELTKIKSAVVSRRICAKVGRRLGLQEVLIVGKGMTTTTEQLPQSLCAAVIESLVAALYIDGGYEVTRNFVLEHFGDQIDEAAIVENQRNFKSQLQQYAQREFETTPVYELLDEQGPDHSKCFEVGVRLRDRRFPSAWGPSKKEAEQKAAYNALIDLDIIVTSEPKMAEHRS